VGEWESPKVCSDSVTETELPNSLPMQAAVRLPGAIDACGWTTEAVVRSEYGRWVQGAAGRNTTRAAIGQRWETLITISVFLIAVIAVC
jgi:hypothetical protein